MKSKKLNLKFLLDYIFLLVGTIIMSLSLVLFLSPNKIAAGGVSGLCIVLHHLFNTPIGITMLIFNIPLFVIGVKFLGKRFGIRTLVGMISFSFFTDFFQGILHLNALTDNSLLSSLYGGLLLGIGLGIVFRNKASTGGSDIVAQIFSHKGILTAGNTFILIDFFVISFAGLSFKGVEYALWGFIALYISSKVVDIIISGLGYVKACYIISENSNKIKEEIFNRMDRGVTLIKGIGAYKEKEKNIILTILSRREVAKLRDIVKEYDSEAFVIIQPVHTVMGKGFKTQENII